MSIQWRTVRAAIKSSMNVLAKKDIRPLYTVTEATFTGLDWLTYTTTQDVSVNVSIFSRTSIAPTLNRVGSFPWMRTGKTSTCLSQIASTSASSNSRNKPALKRIPSRRVWFYFSIMFDGRECYHKFWLAVYSSQNIFINHFIYNLTINRGFCRWVVF